MVTVLLREVRNTNMKRVFVFTCLNKYIFYCPKHRWYICSWSPGDCVSLHCVGAQKKNNFRFPSLLILNDNYFLFVTPINTNLWALRVRLSWHVLYGLFYYDNNFKNRNGKASRSPKKNTRKWKIVYTSYLHFSCKPQRPYESWFNTLNEEFHTHRLCLSIPRRISSSLFRRKYCKSNWLSAFIPVVSVI